MNKFYITTEERRLITSTPPKECWICDLFSNNIHKDKNGLFIPEKIFEDDGLIEHLHQIIRREISFIPT
ncbi:MAG TPA: hypothetical protein VIH28_12210 [Ignavibacteriaceae bacterium]|nr:MAG: hypothetical protein A2Z59_04545 [Nitrospinae bacterium RIFCSPLOWO2_02_39_17]OGW08534.1 MAG: hypothetical protein A2W77_01940 [Nitrospinae bacterium RIFCSPLOWO2_12_39_16]HAP67408.1 hypothetical protein [Nitrospinota bacterium]